MILIYLLTVLLAMSLALASPVKRADDSVVTVFTILTVSTATTFTTVHSDHLSIEQTTSTLPTESPTATTEISTISPTYTPKFDSLTRTDAASTSTASPEPASFQAPADSQPYAYPILKQHNLHRRNHTVADMSWNDTLAGWADELAHKCYYHHSNDEGDGEYGQNIGAGFSAEDVDIMITDRMYNEQLIHYPGYASEPAENGYDWMHFTQIVWKGSLSVGCATLVCDHLENIADDIPPSFTVCNYYPPGNIVGAFAQNVLPPARQMATIHIQQV